MKKSIILMILIMSSIKLFGQQSIITRFFQMHPPERIWIISHPFSARKAMKITTIAQNTTAQLKADPMLDGDDNGGQVDAFRHAFWMALLVQQMNWNKAFKLGKAHEEGNKLDYDRLRTEEGTIPDMMASVMDLKNNEEGIRIGLANMGLSDTELARIVRDAALAGELYKLKKDSLGNYIDYNDRMIPFEEWHGKWHNEKCLVASNYIFTK